MFIILILVPIVLKLNYCFGKVNSLHVQKSWCIATNGQFNVHYSLFGAYYSQIILFGAYYSQIIHLVPVILKLFWE